RIAWAGRADQKEILVLGSGMATMVFTDYVVNREWLTTTGGAFVTLPWMRTRYPVRHDSIQSCALFKQHAFAGVPAGSASFLTVIPA
ncbi:MAG TPA: hypothetical protein VGD58_30150, partial [Herpetosiphonaceae bacterium]